MFEGAELLDPLDNPIDLWDHKLASEMKSLHEIFAEVVSEQVTVAEWGRVTDGAGRRVQDYTDGLPARLRFRLPRGATAFTLTFPGGEVTQDISEGLNR